jgi:hypothetical protein
VHRAAVAPALQAFLQRLPLERLSTDPERDLYRIP